MRSWLKTMLGIALAGGMVLGSSLLCYAGEWIQEEDGRQWYRNDDGSHTANGWQEIDGKRYYFDENGYKKVNQWLKLTETRISTEEGFEEPYEVKVYYLLDENGVMATSGEWEGGHILPNGQLETDSIYRYLGTGPLGYYDYRKWNMHNTIEAYYEGTLAWKQELVDRCIEVMGTSQDYTTYTIDFQLPSNWSEQCPPPLLTEAIYYACNEKWLHYNEACIWRFDWQTDNNNALRITANFSPAE